MKKIFLTILTIILIISTPTIYADEQATNSASNEEVTENLKERLKDTIKTVQQNIIKTDEKKEPKAFIGVVKDIIQNTINITTKDDSKYASIEEDTVIIRSPGNKIIKPKNIQIDDFIIAMGYIDEEEGETETIKAKRIIVSQTLSLQLSKTSGMGKVTNITSSKITITTPSNEEQELTINKETIVKTKSEILTLKDIEENQNIVYTATTVKTKTTATIIMIVK